MNEPLTPPPKIGKMGPYTVFITPPSDSFHGSVSDSPIDRLPPMLSPRGSFARVAIPNTDWSVVAGDGSRHTMFGAIGSQASFVVMYDIGRNEWVTLDGLLRFQVGCEGFMARIEDVEDEFSVMGGCG
ncbi:hypothetical protein E3N88_20456 [Mikania micrantha]|uniref:Uncharacterized protein n=1 Tax=Mikania micrantha TaxID=192012 RepID=A0A5N6NIW7_9ASTR|nr:hypothetical protein E3N88_20456 [Mikania micrantha]